MTQVTDLLTLAQAGQEAGLDPATLRVQIHNGRLQGQKLGRDWFVTRAELERYLAERWQRSPRERVCPETNATYTGPQCPHCGGLHPEGS